MDDLEPLRRAQKAANEATEKKFGKAPAHDALAYALLATMAAWASALAAFAIADVPQRMSGNTADIVGVIAGVITFACVKWSRRTRSKFWEQQYLQAQEQQSEP